MCCIDRLRRHPITDIHFGNPDIELFHVHFASSFRHKSEYALIAESSQKQSLAELVEKRLGLLQIGSVEATGEPFVNRRE